MAVIALDLGGTKLAAAVFDEQGTCTHRKFISVAEKTGSAVGRAITDVIKTQIREAGEKKIKLSAVAICVPGISHEKTGRVWAPNIPGWDDYPLRDEIRAATAKHHLEVVVDDDRACSVMGERWKGAAHGSDHAVFITVGTGIGVGVVTDGRVLRGAHGISGASGWMALGKPHDKKYKACGHFEYYASGAGLVRAAAEFMEEARDYRGVLREHLSSRAIFGAYEKEDPIARKTISQAIELWGMATANLISLFDPERIIFGGGVFGPATVFLGAIRKEAARWAQPVSMRQVRLTGSLLGSDAALYGAACAGLAAPGTEAL